MDGQIFVICNHPSKPANSGGFREQPCYNPIQGDVNFVALTTLEEISRARIYFCDYDLFLDMHPKITIQHIPAITVLGCVFNLITAKEWTFTGTIGEGLLYKNK
jgi:hypothetical protein